jgi:hypothetical protein
MLLALFGMLQFIAPATLASIAIVAGVGVMVYLGVYLSMGASKVERQTYRGIAVSLFEFAQARLRRLG